MIANQQDSLEIGADVHAIGHPTGETWTYTKGIISQIRPDFSWGAEGEKHQATVIQTQTPINPGNSGGPLLADNEKLVGVNSFKSENSEGLSFAVAANEVNKFLESKVTADAATSTHSQAKSCEPKIIFEGRNKANTAAIRQMSLNCDGWADLVFVMPDDTKVPIQALFDTKKRSKPDGIVLDHGRAGKWDISYWDVNFDDTFPIVGHHPDGQIKPSSFDNRCKTGVAIANFRCR